MAYEMVMPYHLHMPSYFLETFTEYPYFIKNNVPCLKGKLQAYRFIGFYCFACVFQ